MIDDLGGGEPRREAEQLAGLVAVTQPAAMHQLHDMVGDRRAEHMAETGRHPPFRAEQRQRDALAAEDGLECGDGARGDDVDRLVQAVGGSAHEGPRRVTVLDDRERGVGQGAERHHRLAEDAPEGAGHVLAEDGGQPQLAHRDADPPADLPGGALDVGQHVAVLAGGPQWGVLGGAGERAAAAPVDLQTAAHHHRLQRRALRSGADDGRGGIRGERAGMVQRGAGVGFPDADVDDDVRVELGDDVDDAFALRRLEEVELGHSQAAAGRVHVDAHE